MIEARTPVGSIRAESSTVAADLMLRTPRKRAAGNQRRETGVAGSRRIPTASTHLTGPDYPLCSGCAG